MIDGIDECKESVGLLLKLNDLSLFLQEAAGDRQPLHMMLCEKQDLKMSDCFTECISILTTHINSRDDEKNYVKTEIAHRQKLTPGSLFFESFEYTSRLKRLLFEQSKGLFR